MALTPEEEQLLSELQADVSAANAPYYEPGGAGEPTTLLPVRSGGLLGGDSASISNAAPEAPFKGFWDTLFSWTEPEGQISAGGVPMLDYGYYDPKNKQVVNGPIEQAPGLRKSLGTAMEMAGAAIPYAAAGTNPLGAAASYLGMPALSTLGGFLGERGAIGAGLRPPKDFMSSVSELPLEFGANAVLNAPFATAERMAGPGVFGGNTRAYNREITNYEMSQVPGRATESFTRASPKTDAGAFERGQVKDVEPILESTGLFSGNREFDINPESPTVGTFMPSARTDSNAIQSVTQAHGILNEQIPQIRVARDTLVKSYDDAYGALKQASPEQEIGITFDDVFNSPTMLPDGSAGPNLNEALGNIVANRDASEISRAAAVSSLDLIESLKKDFQMGSVSPGKAIAQISNLDNRISTLGGYERGTPEAQAAAIELPILQSVRSAWKNAFNTSLGRIEQVASGKNMNLPAASAVQKLDDAMHAFIPANKQFQQFTDELSRASGTTNIPIKSEDPQSLVFGSDFTRRGAMNRFGDMIGSLFTNPENQVSKFNSNLLRKDREAFSQVGNMFSTRQGPAPIPPSASPGMMGASRVIAGTVQAVNAAAPVLQAAIAKSEEYVPAQELLPPGATSPAAQVHNYNQGKPNAFLPRNLNALDPQGIAMLIDGYAPPEQAQPLLIQWKRIVASGQKKEMAKFLSALTDVSAFPDMPIQAGAVTGLASEFDLGDGVARLFSDIDKMKWEEEIENSTLTTDEKALRISRLRQYGEAVPFNIKLNAVVNPNLTVADKVKINVINSHNFTPRTNTSTGSRKVEY